MISSRQVLITNVETAITVVVDLEDNIKYEVKEKLGRATV
jgi:hypothetical protein